MEPTRTVRLTLSLFFTGLLSIGSCLLSAEIPADVSFTSESIDRYNEHGVKLSERPWWRRQPLIDAALIGDVRLNKWLLDQGTDINTTRGSGFTALMAAAHRGNLEVAKMLLKRGAERDSKDDYGNSAMTYARRMKHHEIVNALQSRNKRQTVTREGQESTVPDHTRPGNGLPERSSAQSTEARQLEIRRLKMYGCPYLSTFYNERRTPLMKAAERGDLKRVKKLLAEGADLEEQNSRGGTALVAAAENGDNDVVAYLIGMGAEVNAGTDYRGTPLTAAACGAHPDTMRLLIEHGANVNEARPLGHSGAKYEWRPLTVPFELAAAMGDADLVDLMINKGARITGRNSLGKLALMVALRNGHTSVAELLQEKGVSLTVSDLAHLGFTNKILNRLDNCEDVNERANHATSALTIAAGQGNLGLVQLLLARGADMSRQGLSALSEAAVNGRLELVIFFMEQGVEVGGRDADLDLVGVVRNRHKYVLELLIANGADVNTWNSEGLTALIQAAESGRADIAQLLIKNGADVNLSTPDGYTAMSAALSEEDGYYGVSKKQRHIDIAALLWKNGAPLPDGLKDVGGSNELFAAISRGSVDAVRMLLDLGADLKVRSYDEADTPLIRAAKTGNMQIAKLLVDRGADVNASNREWFTPLIWAAARGKLGMVKLLLAHGADPGIQNNFSETAYEIAHGKYRQEIRALLKAHMTKNMPAN